MSVDILPAQNHQVLFVAQHMRGSDAAEIFATRWATQPHHLADDVMRTIPTAWVASTENEPVAVVGAGEVHPGVWSVYMFATPRWPLVSFSMTKFVKRQIIPLLINYGAHRAECKSIATHSEAHRWLEILGARRESVLRRYGKGQEDFYYYVWKLEDVRTTQRRLG